MTKMSMGIIIIVFLSPFCVYLYLLQPVHTVQNVCTTSTCIVEAARLMKSLDESVSPCDDFYGFVCGNWLKSRVVTRERNKSNHHEDLKLEVENQLKGLITSIDLNTEPREFVRNVKNYYESCYDTAVTEELGDKPLVSLLDRLGGWPLLLGENWTEVEWEDLYIKLRKEGFTHSFMFSISVVEDFRNKSRYIIDLGPPYFGIGSRRMVLKGDDDPIVKAYKNLMFNTITKLGGSPPERVREEVDKVFEFEEVLANITGFQQRDLTIKELTKHAPNINWLKIFRGYVSEDITEEEPIRTFYFNIIKVLNDILGNPRYNNEYLANVIIWRTILTTMSLLDEQWYIMADDFNSVKYGRNRIPISSRCNIFEPKMSMALNYLYIKKYFNEKKKQNALNMSKSIVKQFRHSLVNNEWMAKETREEAIKKLDKMKLLVGYPEELIVEENVAQYYRGLKLCPNEFFANNGRLNKWNADLRFSLLREEYKRYDWKEFTNMALANAYYTDYYNHVQISAGILQGVFFNENRPKYMNYGLTGSAIAHEITHGFDNLGRKRDSEGKRRNWWDDNTDQVYANKSQCFVEQYSNFTVEEIGQNVNGTTTLSENIADNGGVVQAFKAYLRYVAKKGPEPKLPYLQYTPEQLYWISFGSKWCQKYTIESMREQIETNSHSPGQFRVNGVAMNSQDFSQVFNCPIGSAMNPIEKCKIW